MLEKLSEPSVLTMEQSDGLANQQVRLLSWFSGFVDGEGTLTIVCDWKRNIFSPYFQVCNTNFEALERCKEILTNIGVGYYVRTQKLNKNWKVVWKIQVTGYKRVKKLLDEIYPYLVVKKRQCELMIKFINERLFNGLNNASPDKRFYTKDQLNFVKLIKQLNQRGTSETLRLPFRMNEDKVHT